MLKKHIRKHNMIFAGLLAVTFAAALAAVLSAPLSARAESKGATTDFGAIKPIIAYEFDDASDFGKDTFGNVPLKKAIASAQLQKGEDGGVRFGSNTTLYAETVREGRDFSDLMDAFTLSVWTRPHQSATSRIYCSGMYGHNDGFMLLFDRAESGAMNLTFRIGYNGLENSRSYAIADSSEWIHFAFSVDTATKSLVISMNGKTVATATMTGEISVASVYQVFSLGGFTHTGAAGSYDYYGGEIDDVRIYGYAMDGDVMNAINTAGRGGKLPAELPEKSITEIELIESTTSHPDCADFLVLSNLPQTVTVKSGADSALADICWLNVFRDGKSAVAKGLIVNSPYVNARGISPQITVTYDPKAQLPLTLAPVFTDNLLLSRNRARIYGIGGDEKITAGIYDGDRLIQSVSAECENGGWQLEFADLPVAMGGLTLKVTGSSAPENPITLSNVAVGEVWLASGQSNMDWEVKLTSAPSVTSYKAADYSAIRYFKQSATPQTEVVYPYHLGLKWQTYTGYGSGVGDWSAYATAFALELQKSISAFEGSAVPVGITQVAVGGSKIEQWMSDEALKDTGRKEDDSYTPSEFYNGMLSHLLPFAYDGMIWYQGESNCNDMIRYPSQFSRLVGDIRAAGGGRMPVISAQLVQYNQTDWPQFRQMQWELGDSVADSLINCGIDLGNATDIHPTSDKYLFGSRAAGIAMRYVYGDEQAAGISPYPEKIDYAEGSVTITVRDADLLTPQFDGRAPDGFSVLVNGKWQPAEAEVQGKVIRLSGFSGKATKVSYAQFANTSGYKNGFNFLYNEHDLPLAPFLLDAVVRSFEVSVSDGGATVTGLPQSVREGQKVTMSISCPTDKSVAYVLQNGTKVYYGGGSATFVSAPIYENTVFRVVLQDALAPVRYNVTAKVTGSGTIDLPSDATVVAGEGAIYRLLPDEGCIVGKVKVNGEEIALQNGQVVLSGVTQDVLIEAEFISAPPRPGCGAEIASSSPIAALAAAAGLIVLWLYLRKKPVKKV